MNPTIAAKIKQPEALTRADIHEVLVSIAPARKEQDKKVAAIRRICEARNDTQNSSGNQVWNHLEDFGSF